MTESTERQLGRHDAEIESLQRDMEELKRDVKSILSVLSEAKGGWKTMMLVAGAAGAMGALWHQLAVWVGLVR